jgi:integrase
MELFCDYVSEWLNDGAYRYAISTHTTYRRMAARHFPNFREVALADFSSTLILKYLVVTASKDKHKHKTAKNILSCLSAYCDYLLCRGLLECNPCADNTLITRLRAHYRTARDRVKTKKVALSVQEAVLLLQRAYDVSTEFGLATETLICTGLRVGELAALTLSDIKPSAILISKAIDSHTRQVQSTAKWGSNGRVPVPRGLSDKLRKYIQQRKGTWVFPYVLQTPKLFSKKLGRISDRLGITHATAHVLRRTTITWLVADGVPLAVVQAVARHTTTAMTEQYIDRQHINTDGATETIARRLDSKPNGG